MMPMPLNVGEDDGVYIKYRVFREPEGEGIEHPVEVDAQYLYKKYDEGTGVTEMWHQELEEVTEFVFPLKPDTDHHARVALAAYAASVRVEKPSLASDLEDLLATMNG